VETLSPISLITGESRQKHELISHHFTLDGKKKEGRGGKKKGGEKNRKIVPTREGGWRATLALSWIVFQEGGEKKREKRQEKKEGPSHLFLGG